MLTMHKHFADWYRAAHIEPKADDLEKRWMAVETLIKKPNHEKTLDWIRLFLGKTTRNKDFAALFSQAFKDKDAAFPMRDNQLELRVLAGTTVIYFLEKKATELTDTVALAAVCYCCSDLSPAPLFPDVINAAKDYLLKEALRVRSVDQEMLKGLDVSVEEALNPAIEAIKSGNFANIAATFSKPFNQLVTVTSNLASAVETFQEELDILWWIMGEHSRDLNRKMGDIALSSACLITGKELADVTRILPGPVGAPAFLDKMLGSGRTAPLLPVTIKDAVSSSPRDWRTHFVEGFDPRVEDFCSIHIAVQKSLEANRENDWLSSFKVSSQVNPKKKCNALKLAMQVYYERLLSRAVRMSKG